MAALLFVLMVVLAGPAPGQPLRSLVVGPDAGIVVPPRGAAPLPLRAPVAPLPPLAAAPLAESAAMLGGFGLSAAVPLLPIIAAALLGATAPGSGGGGAAPASTR